MAGPEHEVGDGPSRGAGLDALEEAIHALPAWAEACKFQPVDEETMATALAFVRAIPPGRALPRVASDEDGCVLMGWPATGALSVTVEGRKLHVTARPGSDSRHLPPVAYGGGRLPDEVLSLLPTGGDAAA